MKSLFLFLLALMLIASRATFAQETSPSPAPTPVRPAIAADADPATATRAWLDTVPADKRAKSDAYFEGGYWLFLWNFLLAAAISILLLQSRFSARIRDFAERTTRFRSLQVATYAIAYLLITSVLTFPLDYYQHFVREHAYDLSTQTFGAWFGEQVKMLIIGLIGFTIFLIALYAIFRRAPRTWWM
ncbi:MAG: hypothetical protein ACXWAV_03990, partial [Chthoniobacterales bacterium]